MKCRYLVLAASAAAVTPTQKVVQMLVDMKSKGEKEMHDEQVQFAAYSQFCVDEIAKTEREITEGQERIEKLSADRDKAAQDAVTLGNQVSEHSAEQAKLEGELADAQATRKEERETYRTTHTDYSESVDALKRAIEVLKAQNYDRKQSPDDAKALLQLNLDSKSMDKITAFLATEDLADMYDPDTDITNPMADVYEFRSGGVIEMLEQLEEKFRSERTQLEDKEKNAQHAYDLYSQQTSAEIANLKEQITTKSQLIGKKKTMSSGAESERVDAAAELDADQKYLLDTKTTCNSKKEDFEARQKLRSEEIDVLGQAIEILSGSGVSGAAEKYLPTLIQKKISLISLRSSLRKLSDVDGGADEASQDRRREAMMDYLQIQAKKIGSQMLATMSVHAGADPFAKVKGLIQDLITRLLEEAKDEADHHGWCTTELARNEKTRKEKESDVADLKAEIDGLVADIAMLEENLTDLAAEIADLDKVMLETTKMRTTEKQENELKIDEAKEAQKAVAQAVVLLKDFYAKAGQATALVQQKQEPGRSTPPPVFDQPYTGIGGNGGVMGMLEVIQSDFARLEAETEAAEAAAEREFAQFKEDNSVSRAQKKADSQHKTERKNMNEQELVEKKQELVTTEEELEAANAYFEKLKPSCINTGVSFEDRNAKRQEEIESLKEALQILEGTSLE